MKIWQTSRISRINNLTFLNAVKTSLIHPDNGDHHKKQAEKGIVERFSIMKILAVSTLVLIAIFLSVLPFWQQLPTQFISIIATIATVMIGIALKPVLENVVAGMVITMSRQFRTGDTVMLDGEYGTIEDIGGTYTTIKVWDWRRYVVPNAQMLTKETINYTLHDTYLWAYVEFYVTPQAEMDLVEKLAKQAVKDCDKYWDSEEPKFWIMGMEKDAVKCWAAGWAKNPQDAWALKHQTRYNLIKSLTKHKILSHQGVVLLKK